MRCFRTCVSVIGALLSASGCQDPAGLLERVDFTVAPLAAQTDPLIVAYRFTVTNRSGDTVWFAACDRRITPDVAFVVNGRTVDTSSGNLCLAVEDMTPVPLAPGATYTGDRAVPYRAGVRYVPYLGVGRDRAGDRGARLQARAFDAP
jgi:hypothetical protein